MRKAKVVKAWVLVPRNERPARLDAGYWLGQRVDTLWLIATNFGQDDTPHFRSLWRPVQVELKLATPPARAKAKPKAKCDHHWGYQRIEHHRATPNVLHAERTCRICGREQCAVFKATRWSAIPARSKR